MSTEVLVEVLALVFAAGGFVSATRDALAELRTVTSQILTRLEKSEERLREIEKWRGGLPCGKEHR